MFKEWKPSLKAAVNRLENAIITVSGPAIAISGIIAGIDLLTGGTMFKDIAWLSLTWAICLLLTLDFQVLMLGAKAKRIYTTEGRDWKRKAGEIILIVIIAAAISSVSVQMQSIIARTQTVTTYTDHRGEIHTRNLTIEEATADMGINPVALIWERSALVLILIFMSGWLRDEESREHQTGQQVPAPPVLDYEQIAQALAPLLAPELVRLKTTILTEVGAMIPTTQQITGAITPLLPSPKTEEPAPAIDYEELAKALAPHFEARVRASVTEIKKEIQATITPIPERPAPTIINAASDHRPAIQSKDTQRGEQEEATGERDERLERIYQELKSAEPNKRVSGRVLADKAHANRKYCNEWLKSAHPENDQLAGERDTEEQTAYTVDSRELAGAIS